MTTVCNFNAGPAMLPPSVLEQVQAELRDYHGRGMSIMEMSHRGPEYEAVNAQAEAGFKRLLGVGEGYRVLFLQGGASTQFAMVPLNFLPSLVSTLTSSSCFSSPSISVMMSTRSRAESTSSLSQ